MDPKRAPLTTTQLSIEEKESILRALGHYQIYLFDEMSKGEKPLEEIQKESQKVTSAIKKIHKTIEEETKKV